MGAYFVAVRPPLLPEDERAIGMTLVEAERSVPGLALWLDRVFAVLGGQAIAVGLLAAHLVRVIVVTRSSTGALGVLAGAGLFSVVLMSGVNFLIRSDFKWTLVVPAAAWLLGVIALGLSRSAAEPTSASSQGR
jgi:hypothetical protein